jgi:transcriptional regulator with XRE-family HTH domain
MVKKPWRAFGRELKRQIDLAGKTQADLADATGYSASMISALVQGTRRPKADVVANVEAALNTNGALSRLAASLTTSGVPDDFRDALALEREASHILQYQPNIVPGLLQTEGYARSVVGPGRPWDTPDGVEAVVQARMSRRSLLDRDPRPIIWIVLDWAVLHRKIGRTPDIMRDQWEHLVSLIESRRIKLQVVSPKAREHPGLCPPFRVLRFDDRPTIVYGDHVMGGRSITSAEHVRNIEMVFAALQGEALPPNESLEVLKEEIR